MNDELLMFNQLAYGDDMYVVISAQYSISVSNRQSGHTIQHDVLLYASRDQRDINNTNSGTLTLTYPDGTKCQLYVRDIVASNNSILHATAIFIPKGTRVQFDQYNPIVLRMCNISRI